MGTAKVRCEQDGLVTNKLEGRKKKGVICVLPSLSKSTMTFTNTTKGFSVKTKSKVNNKTRRLANNNLRSTQDNTEEDGFTVVKNGCSSTATQRTGEVHQACTITHNLEKDSNGAEMVFLKKTDNLEKTSFHSVILICSTRG